MRGVLLSFALLLFFTAAHSAAQHDADYDGMENVHDDENKQNNYPHPNENIDNEQSSSFSTRLPDAEEIEYNTDDYDAEFSHAGIDGENVTDVENETNFFQGRNLEGNGDNVSTGPPNSDEEEFEAPEDPKRRLNQPRRDPGTCGEPPTIDRTMIVSGRNASYFPGASVTYSCQFGYVSNGGQQAKCTTRFEWTVPEIRCSPQSCGDPGYVEHGRRIGSLFTFPNSVSFECEEGYQLRGNSARYCQPSGTWSGKLPKCHKLSCAPPPDIKNGKVTYTSLEFGSELRYQCDPGFTLKNHRTRYCAGNRTWSGESPICKDSQCEVPVPPKHGSFQMLAEKPVVDTRVIFTCDPDKVLSGNKLSICMENGDWTFPPPKCIDPCSIPSVPYGKLKKYSGYRNRYLNEVPVGSKIESNEDLFLSCDKDYDPLGKPEKLAKVKCTNGIWTDVPKCEPATCKGEVPKTPNADLGNVDRKHGGVVWYRCKSYFFKAATGNITCNKGTWTGITPVCADSRCYITEVRFSGLTKQKRTTYIHGEFFYPTCEDKKYTPTKLDNRFTCTRGKWAGHFPPCIPASCKSDPPGIDHGRIKQYSEEHSSNVVYECEEGFVLKEREKVQCLFGEWKGTPPGCHDSRCYHRDLPKTQGLEIDEGFTPNGEFMTIKCSEGFTAVESAEPFCSKGVWLQPNSPCRESWCVTSKITNGIFAEKKIDSAWYKKTTVYYQEVELNRSYDPGGVLYTMCKHGTTFQGKGGNTVQVKCLKGQWVPEPACLITGTPFTSRSRTTKQPSVSPRVATTSTASTSVAPSIATEAPEGVCTCIYLNSDVNVVALSGLELVTYRTRVKKGCRVKFHCSRFGYDVLEGPSELVCDTCRDWHTPEFPRCKEPTGSDLVLRFSKTANITEGGEMNLREGEEIDVFCHSVQWNMGFTIWELPQSTLPDGMTFEDFPERTPNGNSYNSKVMRISYADVRHDGVYHCHLKDHRSRTLKIRVTPAAVEQPSCPPFEASDLLTVSYEEGRRTVNSQVHFSCREGYFAEGPAVVTCQSNGLWSGGPPRCARRCPELSAGEGLAVVYSSVGRGVGSTANFHCFEPRRRKGESHSTCKWNGEWSNPVPACVLPNCSMDALFRKFPEGVTTDLEQGPSDTVPGNTTLKLRCTDNLVLDGIGVATCDEKGQWIVPNIQCVSGCTALQPPDESLIIEPLQNSYRMGDGVILSCPPGMELSSEVERLMCLHEGWSEKALPSCSLPQR